MRSETVMVVYNAELTRIHVKDCSAKVRNGCFSISTLKIEYLF